MASVTSLSRMPAPASAQPPFPGRSHGGDPAKGELPRPIWWRFRQMLSAWTGCAAQ